MEFWRTQECEVTEVSTRICEFGTEGCDIEHSSKELTEEDFKVVAWVSYELYMGGAWHRMEKERPEINDVMERFYDRYGQELGNDDENEDQESEAETRSGS